MHLWLFLFCRGLLRVKTFTVRQPMNSSRCDTRCHRLLVDWMFARRNARCTPDFNMATRQHMAKPWGQSMHIYICWTVMHHLIDSQAIDFTCSTWKRWSSDWWQAEHLLLLLHGRNHPFSHFQMVELHSFLVHSLMVFPDKSNIWGMATWHCGPFSELSLVGAEGTSSFTSLSFLLPMD